MSRYSDFPIDFLKRTQINLNNYTGDYEVTNLINNCLGLIVIPKELIINRLADYTFSDEDKKFGITKLNIKHETKENYELKNVLRHIRNGLAHGRIEQESTDNTITGLRIFDCNFKTKDENFSIEFTVQEFKDFAIKISDEFSNPTSTLTANTTIP